MSSCEDELVGGRAMSPDPVLGSFQAAAGAPLRECGSDRVPFC